MTLHPTDRQDRTVRSAHNRDCDGERHGPRAAIVCRDRGDDVIFGRQHPEVR